MIVNHIYLYNKINEGNRERRTQTERKEQEVEPGN